MGDVSELIDGIVMPTPAAVLKAAELLAGGAAGEEGLGQLVVIDIGGSTTDVHSIAEGRSAGANVIYEGLQEPYCKRTVEADIGMRYNAPNLMPDAHGDVSFSDPAKKGEKVRIELKEYEKYIDKVQKQVHYLPQSEKEMAIERCMARNAAMRAMSRHAGVLKTVYTPSGEVFVQRGKDLSAIGTVIGTGGILVNNNLPGFVLSGVRYMHFGNLPFSDLIKGFHNEKLAQRSEWEGREVGFQMVIDDVYAMGRGMLVGHQQKKKL